VKGPLKEKRILSSASRKNGAQGQPIGEKRGERKHWAVKKKGQEKKGPVVGDPDSREDPTGGRWPGKRGKKKTLQNRAA